MENRFDYYKWASAVCMKRGNYELGRLRNIDAVMWLNRAIGFAAKATKELEMLRGV